MSVNGCDAFGFLFFMPPSSLSLIQEAVFKFSHAAWTIIACVVWRSLNGVITEAAVGERRDSDLHQKKMKWTF